MALLPRVGPQTLPNNSHLPWTTNSTRSSSLGTGTQQIANDGCISKRSTGIHYFRCFRLNPTYQELMQIKWTQEPMGLACIKFSSEIHLQDGWKTPSLPGRLDDIRPLRPKTLFSEQVSLQQTFMPRKLPTGTDVIQLTCQEDSHRCPLTCCPRPFSKSVLFSAPTWGGSWPLKPTHIHHPFIPRLTLNKGLLQLHSWNLLASLDLHWR